ncbi:MULTISPECIES: hypothetical protein [Cyanophyceae]|nr:MULTISPECIES: hypothetical protein [Cyanophyceae]
MAKAVASLGNSQAGAWELGTMNIAFVDVSLGWSDRPTPKPDQAI